MKYLITGTEFLKRHEGFKLVGQDANLKLLSSILVRSKAASVLLAGPGGVGATALCMGLQASKSDEHAPFDIVAKRMFWLNTDELFSSGNSSDINSGWQKIMQILARTPESILFIEDTRDFIEAARNAGCSHFINGLAAAVKNGDTQAVLECRDDDVAFILKSHSDFKECFTMIELGEPVGDALDQIAHAASDALSRHHGIRIDEDAIDIAIKLTTKYRTRDSSLSRAQPERTANLLDRALSSYRLAVHKDIPDAVQAKIRAAFKDVRDGEVLIDELEEDMDEQIEREKNIRSQSKATDEFNEQMANNFDSEAVKELKTRIAKYRVITDQARDEFKNLTADLNDNLTLTKDMVMNEFSRISGIPTSKLNQNEIEKLRSLEEELEKQIYGQHDAMRKLANAIKVARIGGRHGAKPQAAFMFVGPSGVGKTETGKALARVLLDDEAALTRFDMSEYMEKQAVAKMIGAPPGYEGFENGGILTNAMRKNPNRIILFDEIEKAHPDVFNIFLQILSDGRLTDSAGLTVSFSDSIILMSSNIGQKYFLNTGMAPADALELALQDLMADPSQGGAGLRPELLNRFAGRQNIVAFKTLGMDSINKIVRREVDGMDKAYAERGIRTIMSDETLQAFTLDHYDPITGARGLPGYIEANLEPIITQTILDNPEFTGQLHVGYEGGKFTTELIPEKVKESV